MYPNKILMVPPLFFEVVYKINPYMRGQSINHDLALLQWHTLRDIYTELGFEVHLLEAQSGLPDMVFSANTFLSLKTDKGIIFVLSKMANEQRIAEVDFTNGFLKGFDGDIFHCPETFEGMGDAIWNYETQRLYLGCGSRTSEKAFRFIKSIWEETFNLKLIDPYFYHLDTCFAVLNKKTVLIVREAFDKVSYQLIEDHFSEVIEIPRDAAIKYFVCNAHCPDGKNIIVQTGGNEYLSQLKGFNIIEIDTSEFMKSGGSVYCMKNQFFA